MYMDVDKVVLLASRFNLIFETILFTQFIVSLYLLFTGNLKNGVFVGMLVLFLGHAFFHISVIVSLVLANIYYISLSGINPIAVWLVILSCISRLILVSVNSYLFHVIRKHTSVMEMLDVHTN